jgi:hypothetical protein
MGIRQHIDAELLQSCEAFALEQASTIKIRSELFLPTDFLNFSP